MAWRQVAIVKAIVSVSLLHVASGNTWVPPKPGHAPFSCKVADDGIANLSKPDYDFNFALAGITLRAGVKPFTPFAVVNTSLPYGVGKNYRFGGPVVELLDQISRQHGVEVKFEVMRDPNRSAETIGEYVYDHMGEYDLLVGPFIDTAPRRKRGVAFSTTVADFSLSLYMMRKEATEPSFLDNALFWLQPLDWSGYLTVFFVWTVPSFIMWRIEDGRQPGFAGYWNALWRGFLIIVGIKGSLPNWTTRRPVGRLVSMLWGFLALIVTASYSSGLTRFLIYEGTVGAEVRDITEFAARGHRLCVSHNFFNEKFAQQVFSGKVLGFAKEDLPKAVVEGKCDGFLERDAVAQVMMVGGQPQTLPQNRTEPPYGCMMKTVGRRIMFLSASYAADRRHCKGHIMDVVSSWIEGAKRDATMIRLMQRCLSEVERSAEGEPLCPALGAVAQANKKRVTSSHLLGVVLVTFVPMFAVYCYVTLQERSSVVAVGDACGGQRVSPSTREQASRRGNVERSSQTIQGLARRNAELEEALTSQAVGLARLICSADKAANGGVVGKAKGT